MRGVCREPARPDSYNLVDLSHERGTFLARERHTLDTSPASTGQDGGCDQHLPTHPQAKCDLPRCHPMSRMLRGGHMSCGILLATLCTSVAQVQFPILQIPARQPLPALGTSRDSLLLNMVPNEIRVSTVMVYHYQLCHVCQQQTAACVQGPGDNTTGEPYVLYTGRVYNNSITPGVARVKQGMLQSQLKTYCMFKAEAEWCQGSRVCTLPN